MPPTDGTTAPEFDATELAMSDCREVLCRVFDDGADVGMEEFLAWYQPDQWLHPYRALGAFIRTRLTAERAHRAQAEALLAEARAEVLAEKATRGRLYEHLIIVHGCKCEDLPRRATLGGGA